MAHKHLHELLKEDQEPFQLKNYIAQRRGQLKRPNNPRTALQFKKRRPITDNPQSSSITSKRSFYKHACFLSFHESPDVRKSPFLDFPSPLPKSPIKEQNGSVLLQVPARTAALLLEAAMRVQSQQSTKNKTQIKNVGFGVFGSILKRLKDRSGRKKREIGNAKSVKNEETGVEETRKRVLETRISCSCNNSRLSSAGWSESNEEKSLDLESSSSCRSEDSLEEAFAAYEKRFCSSPLSPFRFALQRSPSSGCRTPDFSSPAGSPGRQNTEEKENYDAEGINNDGVEDEEKEQCSPVSVLDPPFEEDDDRQECGDDNEYEDDYDHDCSYAIVQRAKLQLLDKLRRFEKLAELDPIALEELMMEQTEEEEEEEEEDDSEDQADDESLSLHRDDCIDTLMTEVFSRSRFQQSRKIPADMKRLVSDLISEEMNGFSEELAVKRVCERLNLWKEVQPNTIDMMVQLDFGREFDGWKKHQQEVGEVAMDIELAIFRLLVEELAEELVY